MAESQRLNNRIKAIVSLVESESWKKANKATTQLLQEFPNSPIAKARRSGYQSKNTLVMGALSDHACLHSFINN